MNEVPKHLQSTPNYQPANKKKETKLKKELKKAEQIKIKKSHAAVKRRKKENSTMKTLTFPGYRK